MESSFTERILLPEFRLWSLIRGKRVPLSFDLEITPRCNNNCRHCYINVPACDRQAQKRELSLAEIMRIADEAVALGAVWCLITGGEPLLRKDFSDIYIYLKKKGLLVAVFTNATLITREHIELFKRYPPRDVEVTVYGVTKDVYEGVSRVPGTFDSFMRGLGLLLDNGVKVRLKAMALRSNVHQLAEIARFCRQRTKDYFRFDPFLHLRFDRDQGRDRDIISERLLPEEVIAIEQADPERARALTDMCGKIICPQGSHAGCGHIFHCGAGNGGFTVGYDGTFRLCSSLHHPDCVFDLRRGSLAEAWFDFVPRVRGMRSKRKEFLERCRVCPIINLCLFCPAHADLETGALDQPVDCFCELAHARAKMLGH